MLRSEGMKRERRQDAAALPLGKPERTPQGGLRAPANLTRSGVFTYRNPDGSPRREYRPPSEVFAPEALASLAGAPVTREHPPDGYVTADDWRHKAVGHAGEAPRQADDGIHVEGMVYVQDSDTIAAIDSGELGEISLGYDQVYVPGPGTTPEGESYDGIQTMLRYNHVALVPKGRAGPSVALRLDSNGDQIPETSDSMTKITIAGKEYVAGSPEAAAATSALEQRLDAAEKSAKSERRNRVAIQAKSAGVTVRNDADETSIMSDTIKKIAPDLDIDGASPEFIMGAFAASISFALGSVKPSAAAKPGDEKPTEDKEPEGEPGAAPPATGAEKIRQDAANARHERTSREDAEGDAPDVIAHRKMMAQGRGAKA